MHASPPTAPGPADPPDPSALLEAALPVAAAAAEQILRYRERGVAVAATKSSAVDVVTEADRAAEEAIVATLRRARPDDSILGEEGGLSVEGTSGVTWLVDPIDGTVNYLYDLPAYAVSIAAAVADPEGIGGWRSLAGVVVNPRLGETYAAVRGGGATLNGRPLTVNAVSDLSQALVATGFGYSPERRVRQARALPGLLAVARDIRRMGAASLDLCAVAAGRVDGYFEAGLNAWDWGAGALIAAEAGAVVLGDRSGAAPGPGFLLAAAPGIASELLALADPAQPADGEGRP